MFVASRLLRLATVALATGACSGQIGDKNPPRVAYELVLPCSPAEAVHQWAEFEGLWCVARIDFKVNASATRRESPEFLRRKRYLHLPPSFIVLPRESLSSSN